MSATGIWLPIKFTIMPHVDGAIVTGISSGPVFDLLLALASPAVGHCMGHVLPLDFHLFNFSGHFRAAYTNYDIRLRHVVSYAVKIYRPVALLLFIARIS